jgi:hypothetical protein
VVVWIPLTLVEGVGSGGVALWPGEGARGRGKRREDILRDWAGRLLTKPS